MHKYYAFTRHTQFAVCFLKNSSIVIIIIFVPVLIVIYLKKENPEHYYALYGELQSFALRSNIDWREEISFPDI